MTAAVYYTGWENGFQITLVGITLMVVISEYLGESIQGEKAFLAKKSFAEVLSEMGGEERVAE